MTLDLDRYNRLVGIVPTATLNQLGDLHVLIAGVGGTGGQLALDLARLGVGHLTLADFDVYERHNMNRQAGCFESTLGHPKIDVIARMCRDINPRLCIHRRPEGVTAENAAEVLKSQSGCPAPHFVAELIDVAGVPSKRALHQAARHLDIPCLTAPMIGFGAALFVFRRGSLGFQETLAEGDRYVFDRLVPALGSYMDRDTISGGVAGRNNVPTCGIGANIASAMIVAEIVRGLIHGESSMLAAPNYRYIDLVDFKVRDGRIAIEPTSTAHP